MADRLLEYVALLCIDLRRSGWMAAEGSGDVGAHAAGGVTAAPSGMCRLRLAELERAPPELRDLEPRLAYRLVGAGGYASDDAADGNPADVEGMMPYDALVDATLLHRVILHSRETEHGTGFSRSTIPRTPFGDLLALDAASGQGLAPALARAEAQFSAADDQALCQSFAVWCRGILSDRSGPSATYAHATLQRATV